MAREGSHADVKGNLHFMKKLPSGAEASNVLVGEVDFLTRYITAFVRLKNAVTLGDLTEVSFPFFYSRFFLGFVWLFFLGRCKLCNYSLLFVHLWLLFLLH